MNSLSASTPQKFSLLSFGRRGVGKTVFLAGSYAELHSYSQQNIPHQLWFDCQDSDVQTKVDELLSYIAVSGKYPPSTMKITNFDFTMKSRRQRGSEAIAHFRWWDIPGEFCRFANTDFRTIVFNSNGCCVFIDAFELAHNRAYLQELDRDTVLHVKALAKLVSLNKIKYRFALILTKCDLLKLDPIMFQRLEEGLQPLTNYLDAVKVKYKTFYSEIPVVALQDLATLRAKGAAAPLLWMVSELSKVHNPGLINNLRNLLTTDRQSSFSPEQELSDDLLPSINNQADMASTDGKSLGLHFPTTHKYILLTSLAVAGLVGLTGLYLGSSKWFHQSEPDLAKYEQNLQRNPNDRNALETLATVRIKHGQFQQALPLVEKLVQQEPKNLEWELQLARLWIFVGQLPKAEKAYDQILAQQKNNFNALYGKAMLRATLGDPKTSKVLFVQAEKAAPAKLKAHVRSVAQEMLKNRIKTDA